MTYLFDLLCFYYIAIILLAQIFESFMWRVQKENSRYSMTRIPVR